MSFFISLSIVNSDNRKKEEFIVLIDDDIGEIGQTSVYKYWHVKSKKTLQMNMDKLSLKMNDLPDENLMII